MPRDFKPRDGLDDAVIAAGRTHGRHGEVGVAPGAVPVAFLRLGVEGADAVVLLRDPQHDVPSHGEVIAHPKYKTNGSLGPPVWEVRISWHPVIFRFCPPPQKAKRALLGDLGHEKK